MPELPKLISKTLWFVLFNVIGIIYLAVTGTLHWDGVSIFSCGLALLLMNFIAWVSARKYKDWK